MPQQTIMVTGSAGFIGFNVSLELMRRGHLVIGVDNFNDYYPVILKEARSEILRRDPLFIERRLDLCGYAALDEVMKDFKIDRVCHLAAQAGVRYSIDHPHVYSQSNVVAFVNILEAVRHHDIPRLVYASSSSVYGGNKNIPFSVKDNVDHPISLYAATKKANELMAHCYSHLYGFQTVGLRFFTVYGPWGRPDMAMWLFAEAIRQDKPIKVFNHGDMRRDFTFVDDIVAGITASLFTDGLENYEVFNLGNHRSEQLLDMIELIEKQMGREAEKIMLPLQPGDVPETYADIDASREKLGYNPATPISEGVPAFIKWYRENSELTDKIARDKR